MKKYFFGWQNCKWFTKEIVKLYSNEESYFSKKRIESGFAFIVMEWGLIHWLILNITKLTVSEMILWASVNAAISGYMISKIQQEKKEDETKL